MAAKVDLESVRAAQRRIRTFAVRTPLVRLPREAEGPDVYLKLENLQPTGSFKIRGAGNSFALADPDRLQAGVFTVSAGNMAQAVAWHARRHQVPCTVIVHDDAPATKIAGLERLGAEIVRRSVEECWEIATTRRFPPLEHRLFLHPFADPSMICGNGTIGLEILEDLPEPDAVVVPFGGGGLFTGIATAVRAMRPHTRLITCEPESAAPLVASVHAGSAQTVERRPTFVDGIGARSVLPEMWERLRPLVDRAVSVPIPEIANAVRFLLERARILAEGAGATSVAAARRGAAGNGTVVCVVSGGNLDLETLRAILGGSRFT